MMRDNGMELAGKLMGLIEKDSDGLRMTLFTRDRRAIAVVVGSRQYLLRALVAVGLSSPVLPFAKDLRRSRLAFVSDEPSHRNA